MRLRLGIAAVAFVLSLWTIIPAPTLLIWVMTLIVTEWGHWFAAATLALLVWNFWAERGWGKTVTCTLLIFAAGLFSIPVFEAIPIAHRLPEDLTRAFGSRPERAGVPSDPIQFAKLWRSTRSGAVQFKALRYSTQDGTSLALDYYSNGAPGDRPCIVVVHGGAWHSDNEKELSSWNPRLAQLGYRGASIAYSLAPKSHWPAQKEDLLAALAYLKANAFQLGIDPTQFVLLGRSAGAQIVLATAYASHDASIRGCIASYPPTDMNFDYGTGAEHSILNAHQVITQFLGGTPDQVPDIYRDASPQQLVGPNTPPTLLAQGTRDEVVWIENSHRLRDRLTELHRPVYLLEMPWATHGFDLNTHGPGGQLEFYAMAWFLGSVLSTSP